MILIYIPFLHPFITLFFSASLSFGLGVSIYFSFYALLGFDSEWIVAYFGLKIVSFIYMISASLLFSWNIVYLIPGILAVIFSVIVFFSLKNITFEEDETGNV